MRHAVVVTALASFVAAFVVAQMTLGIWSFCSDSANGCTLRNFLGEPVLVGLVVLSGAFVASGTGMLRERNWGRLLGVAAWLASAGSVIYGITTSGSAYDLADRLYQAALTLPGLVFGVFLALPVTHRHFVSHDGPS